MAGQKSSLDDKRNNENKLLTIVVEIFERNEEQGDIQIDMRVLAFNQVKVQRNQLNLLERMFRFRFQ